MEVKSYTHVDHLDVLTRRLCCALLPVLAIKDCPPDCVIVREGAARKVWYWTDLSLSSLMLVITTLLGWMPMGTVAPFDLSRWTRSTWITHFLRYTCVTLPSRPLYLPRTMRTSSSLRMGIERVYSPCETPPMIPSQPNPGRTLYLPRSSRERAEDMIFLRTDEGAEKCALRDLRRDEETSICQSEQKHTSSQYSASKQHRPPERHPLLQVPIQPFSTKRVRSFGLQEQRRSPRNVRT